jgi:phage terminase large subunit-like protein
VGRPDFVASSKRMPLHLWRLGTGALTRWMPPNVAVAQDPAGKLKPAKDKSNERIDGIVASIMAIGRAMVAQEEPQPEYSLFFV